MGQEIVRYSAHLLRGIPLDRSHAPCQLHISGRKGELWGFDTRTSEQTDLRESEAITFRYSVWRGNCEACAESTCGALPLLDLEMSNGSSRGP